MTEGVNAPPNGPRNLTLAARMREGFEAFRKLFNLNVSYDEIISKDTARLPSLVRQILSWSYQHSSDNGRRSYAQVSKLFGRDTKSMAEYAERRVRFLGIHSADPVFNELFQLMLEAALHIAGSRTVPKALSEQIVDFKYRHTIEDVLAIHFTEAPKMRGSADENLSPRSPLRHHEKMAIGAVRSKYRGSDTEGNILHALDDVDKIIFDMTLRGEDASAISRELENRQIKKSRPAVIGRANRVFGGLQAISENRLVVPTIPGGEWIYKKPPR